MYKVDYPNRMLGLRYAAADPSIDNGDISDVSFGNIALANMQPGDTIPNYGTVESVSLSMVVIKDAMGNKSRYKIDTVRMERLVRDVGNLISMSAHLSEKHLGDCVKAIERDPAFRRENGIVMLKDV